MVQDGKTRVGIGTFLTKFNGVLRGDAKMEQVQLLKERKSMDAYIRVVSMEAHTFFAKTIGRLMARSCALYKYATMATSHFTDSTWNLDGKFTHK